MEKSIPLKKSVGIVISGLLLIATNPLLSQEIISASQIGQLTGQPSMNNTGSVNVYGTDLGSMFLHSNGKIYFLFGDTFGPPGPPSSSGDWRSKTMAFTTDTTASDGIIFDAWITDSSGMAKALVEGDHAPNDGAGEVTKIVTAGFSVGQRQFIWFMSVKQWGNPGQWEVNYSKIAYSDDNGNTWNLTEIQHTDTSNFIQVAVAAHNGYLYIWGIPAGRFGSVKLARVLPGDILDGSSYQYYNGSGWSNNENDAVIIVPSPVGELSVIWNPYLQSWLMMYLNENKACIEARFAAQPQGPWSAPETVVCSDRYPALYGAYMHEKYMDNNGETVYFLMSQYGPYNVFLMKAKFRRKETGLSEADSSVPDDYPALLPNYPNPFNPTTTLRYRLGRPAFVTIEIFNPKGERIAVLLNESRPKGNGQIVWYGKNEAGEPVAPGIYICKMTAGMFSSARKLVLIR